MSREEKIDALYAKEVAELEAVIDAMQAVSQSTAARFEAPRIGWASALFTRLIVLSTSLNRVLPKSRFDSGKHHGVIWDFSAVATLSRTVLECDLMLFYLGLEDPGEQEWHARLTLMHLHDATARVDMLRTLLADDKQAAGVDAQRDELIERLKNNEWFSKLPLKQQTHFLRGENIRFEIQDGVLERLGRDVAEYRSWYRVLSAHAHSYSLAFHRMLTDERGKGVENDIEKGWMASTLHYVLSFLRPSTDRYKRLFPDVPDARLASRRRFGSLPANSPLLRGQ